MEALPAPSLSSTAGSVVGHQRQALAGEYWDLPVEHAHAAFERALARFVDASGPTPPAQPSPRPGEQAPAGSS